MTLVLGVDPGINGGLAIVSGNRGERARLIRAIDAPTTGEGPKRRISSAVLDFIRSEKIDHAFIERAQAMPTSVRTGRAGLPDEIRQGQGASSAFNYGRAVGALEMAIAGCLVPLTVIESTAWKKAHALIKRDKEDSRQRALQLFPEGAAAFARKLDHNRAESSLIAWYGLMLIHSGNNLALASPARQG
jgi:hypothetical protein